HREHARARDHEPARYGVELARGRVDRGECVPPAREDRRLGRGVELVDAHSSVRKLPQGASMPQYLMLIYVPAEGGPTPEEMAEMSPRWDAFTENLQASGLFVAGDALERTDTATTLRERNGELQITDGPFAETKEALGGYYLV